MLAGDISIGVLSIYSSASLTSSGVKVSNTLNPFSECPPINPKATDILRPNLSVPGIPTHIPFLYTFGLTNTECFTISSPNNSLAFAQASATATGSVHPNAGFTSAFNILTNCSFTFLIILSLQNIFDIFISSNNHANFLFLI